VTPEQAALWANRVITDCIAEAGGDIDAALAAASYIVETQPIPLEFSLSIEQDADAGIALSAATRRIGEKWQGQSGRWFTKNQQGRVVPAKAPGGTHVKQRWSKRKAIQS
jgi:hypothetical protein